MSTWEQFFFEEIHKPSIRNLVQKTEHDYKTKTIYPRKDKILNAFCLTPYEDVRCVIVGQDPYHNPGQAMGLSFSVPGGIDLPPSLVNIFTEYHNDLGYPLPKSGDLTEWGKNGVLLLNSVLHVRYGQAFSCAYPEYQILFNDVIRFLNKREERMVFILWGSSAQKCRQYIDESYHYVIASPHPSPLSAYRGFFNSHPFSKTNEFLVKHNEKPIDWRLK